MNTPDSPTPGGKTPLEGETGDPKVNAAAQDVVTNKDDAEDSESTDKEQVDEALNESEPTADLNTDNHITNNDSAGTDKLETDEQF